MLTRRQMLGIAAASALGGPAGLAAATLQGGLRFELYSGTGGGFRWRLKAANNKTIASSGEAYKTKAACRDAIDLIKREAASAVVKELS